MATVHGGKRTPEYKIWEAMKRRCYSPASNRYHRYGGRGIAVCERWRKFENFLADIGPRPSPEHSIDRIDNDGPYSPENCRWATLDEQAANKANTKLDGEAKSQVAWLRNVLGYSSVEIGRYFGVVSSRIRAVAKEARDV